MNKAQGMMALLEHEDVSFPKSMMKDAPFVRNLLDTARGYLDRWIETETRCGGSTKSLENFSPSADNGG